MANRHLARSVVLQVLFERDQSGGVLSLDEAFGRLTDYSAEFGARDSDMSFMKQLLSTAFAKQKEVDEVIVRAAPEWPLEKIAAIDRNILRLGLTELLYADRKQEIKKTGNMPVEELVGAVVYARDAEEVYLGLVHDIFGHWTLSKGKLQPDESLSDGVKRKVKEEIGLDVEVEDQLGENEYIANDSKATGGKKKRHATYLMARATFADLTLKREGGLDDAQWFPLASVGDLNFYDDILPVVTRAINLLAQKDRR